MWHETARRLKDQSAVVGYDLMVEPEKKNHRLWNELACKITQAIREVDSRTPILVGAADWSTADSLGSLQPTGDSGRSTWFISTSPIAIPTRRQGLRLQAQRIGRGDP